MGGGAGPGTTADVGSIGGGTSDALEPALNLSAPHAWLCYFVSVFVLAFAVSVRVLGSSVGEATMFAAGVTLSDTGRVREALEESDSRALPIGKALVEVLPFQDLLLGPVLAVPTVLHHHLSSHGLSFQLLRMVMLDAVWLSVIVFLPRILIPAVIRRLTSSRHTAKGKRAVPSELLTIVVISYSLGMALMSEWMSLSYSFGALVSGVLWARVNQDLGPENAENVRRAEHVVQTLASLFGSLYMACLGMIVSPDFMFNHARPILLLILFVVLLKTGMATLVLRKCLGFPLPVALAGGASLGHLSITALFFTGRAQEFGLMSREMHLTTLSAIFLMMALTPVDALVMRRARRLALKPGLACLSCADLLDTSLCCCHRVQKRDKGTL